MAENIIRGLLGPEGLVSVYMGPGGEISYLIIASVRDTAGIKSRLYSYLKGEDSGFEEHRGIVLRPYSSGGVYALGEGLFFASNSPDLVKKAIDLKREKGRVRNFNSVYPWVEGKMARRSDGYFFSAGENLFRALGENLPPALRFIQLLPSRSALHNIYADKGLKLHSYMPRQGSGKQGRPDSLEIMPSRPAFMQAAVDADLEAAVQMLTERNIISRKLSEDALGLASELEGEISAALFSSPRRGEVVPGIVLFIRSAGSKAYEQSIQFLSSALDISFRHRETEEISYHYARLPLFFTSMDISVGERKFKRNNFIMIASSRELFKRTASLTPHSEETFSQSSQWKKIKNHIPSNYSSAYYADMEYLSSALGPLLSVLSPDPSLREFLASSPFRWTSPAGGASISKKGFKKSYSFIPLRDLETEEWEEIIPAAAGLFK